MRLDFLLIYDAKIVRKEGLSPREINKTTKPQNALERLIEQSISYHHSIAQQLAVALGQYYEQLELTVHGGFDIENGAPQKRITGIEDDAKENFLFVLITSTGIDWWAE